MNSKTYYHCLHSAGSELSGQQNGEGEPMSFQQCACHVFAITGYLDDNQMQKVNGLYANYYSSGQVDEGRPRGWSAMNTLATLTAHIRGTTGANATTLPIEIYGGFRPGQLLPEHMWVEYKGWIYDTMPDYDCNGTVANAQTRQLPYLETRPFTERGDEVAHFTSVATVAQLVNIGDASKRKKENIGD